MTALLFRLVPQRRLRAAEAVLATCNRSGTYEPVRTAERRVWELVDPGADDAEFAAAVVVTEQAPAGVTAQVVAVAIAHPDADAVTSQLVEALVAELRRTGIGVVTPGGAGQRPASE